MGGDPKVIVFATFVDWVKTIFVRTDTKPWTQNVWTERRACQNSDVNEKIFLKILEHQVMGGVLVLCSSLVFTASKYIRNSTFPLLSDPSANSSIY